MDEAQTDALNQMLERERTRTVVLDDRTRICTRLGIYADPPGSGKTRTLVELIRASKQSENPDAAQLYLMDGPLVCTMVRAERRACACTVVFASVAVRTQWMQELSTCAPGLRYARLDNVTQVLGDIPNNFDVVVVSQSVYKHLLEAFPNTTWKRFIFDDADLVKLASTSILSSSFTWLVMPYVDNVTRRHGLLARMLPASRRTCEDLVVRATKTSDALEQLQSDMVTRTTHGCLPTHITDVGCAGPVDEALGHLNDDRPDDISRAAAALGCRTLESLQSESDIMIQERAGQPCTICAEPIRHATITECGHVYCLKCLLRWFRTRQTCPVCRADIADVRTSLRVVIPDRLHTEEPTAERMLTRYATMQHRVLPSMGGESCRVLVVTSKFTIGLRRALNSTDRAYLCAYGCRNRHHKTWEKCVRDYKSGKVPIWVIHADYVDAVAGLDLPETTDVVMYDEHIPEVCKRIVLGRAVRICGRSEPLRVHTLVAQNS